MADKKEVSKIKARQLDRKAAKKILKFEGIEYIQIILSLYQDIFHDLEKIDQERSELADSIKTLVLARIKFINEAWEDSELTKEEKKKIYEDYMDTSKAYQQYLIDKEKQLEKSKQKKETVKVVSIIGIIVSVTCGAVVLAAQTVLSAVNARK